MLTNYEEVNDLIGRTIRSFQRDVRQLDELQLKIQGLIENAQTSMQAILRLFLRASSPGDLDRLAGEILRDLTDDRRRLEAQKLKQRLAAEGGAMVHLKSLATGDGFLSANGGDPIRLSPMKYRLVRILLDRDPQRRVASVGQGWRLASEVRRAMGTREKPISANYLRNIVSRLRETLRDHGVNEYLVQTRRSGKGKTLLRIALSGVQPDATEEDTW